MKISVITVCYNSIATLQDTLESILRQTYPDVESIVVDGASKDGTVELIEKYSHQFSGRMKWLSEPDKGIYDAMNKGIKMSQGDIIGIINSNDWYEPDSIAKVIEHATGAKYEVVYGMVRYVKDEQECRILFNRHEFLESSMICHPGCFVSKKTYEDFGAFSTAYKYVSDYELMLRLYEHKEVVFTPVYDILADFSMGGVSSTGPSAIENAKLRYRKGLISRKKYLLKVVQARIKDIVG